MKGDGNCPTYCKHGGVCELDEGHEGLHSSGPGNCTWGDAETVSKEYSDSVFLAKAEALGEGDVARVVLGMQDLIDPRRRPS